jgi:hypothetical protein
MDVNVEEHNTGQQLADEGHGGFNSNPTAEDEDGAPHVGMVFDSETSAKSSYDEYSRRVGFKNHVTHSNRTNTREYGCTGKEGLKRQSGDSCDAMLRIESKSQSQNNAAEWAVTKFVKEHNHSTTRQNKIHCMRPRRHFAGTKNVPEGVMFVSMDRNRTTRIAPPIQPNLGRRTLGKDAQNLLDYLKKMQAENPGFYYAIQLDDENRMTNVFWADARSRASYSNFGDVVTFDTMYKVKQYKVPFAPFTGVNHHGQTILFGCALLLDESESTFLWLFKTFQAAMNDRAPTSLITDPDRAIQTTAARVFPAARIFISKWHVLREGQERLAHVCYIYPQFQVDLYNCINLTDTIEDFESSWDSILDRYDLRRNDWLQSIYSAREKWVPVYFRGVFFAGIFSNMGVETSFFDGYVDQQTTVPLFFRQYEKALMSSFGKEIEADFESLSTNPVLKTPSPMEKQAANLYTKKIFSKFQEELVETFVYTANRIDGDGNICTFGVAKYEDDKAYTVSVNFPEMKASCSCQMFECSGILCRHILTVFTVTNVLTLPSHYILRRWMKNAKSCCLFDEQNDENGLDSLSNRYNNLCREAIKFAEEGAIAIDTYNVAITALREGGKKIANVKSNVAKVIPPSSSGAVISDERRAPFLWPRQDYLTKTFNLNDSNIIPNQQSVSDLNFPRMAPVSLHPHSDKMMILPCLKSMTWVMENKNLPPANRIAVINLKLQDYSRTPSLESEVKFQLSTVTLEPMLRSMAYISDQLSSPANRVAVINLKLQDTDTSTGESEVKFQVSKDTLGAMLRSMAYIREQLSSLVVELSQTETPLKKQRK